MTAPVIPHMTWGKLNFRVLEITGYRTVPVTTSRTSVAPRD